MNTNSEQTETIAQEAYRLLKDVDTNIWITTFMSNGCGIGCALGHYNRLKSDNPNDFGIDNMSEIIMEFSSKLRLISQEYLTIKFNNSLLDIATINNNRHGDYQENTPKERVLHLLTDMIEVGY